MLNNKILTAFLLSLVILTQGFLGNVCACTPSTAIEHVSQSTNVTKTENKKGLSLKQKIGIGLGCASIATNICLEILHLVQVSLLCKQWNRLDTFLKTTLNIYS